jgi:hypothetical protein
MPLDWTIDSQQRLVTIVADGEVTRAAFDSMVDALYAAGVQDYRKLFDGRTATTNMTSGDLLAVGQRMRANQREDRVIGALAVVMPANKAERIGPTLGMLAVARRPMRVFGEFARARNWIMRQPRV